MVTINNVKYETVMHNCLSQQTTRAYAMLALHDMGKSVCQCARTAASMATVQRPAPAHVTLATSKTSVAGTGNGHMNSTRIWTTVCMYS